MFELTINDTICYPCGIADNFLFGCGLLLLLSQWMFELTINDTLCYPCGIADNFLFSCGLLLLLSQLMFELTMNDTLCFNQLSFLYPFVIFLGLSMLNVELMTFNIYIYLLYVNAKIREYYINNHQRFSAVSSF